jgi:hypothetical protein
MKECPFSSVALGRSLRNRIRVAALSDSHKPTKLAVVDVGSVTSVSGNFMNFVVSSLGRNPQVALLEREKGEQLCERALGLALSDVHPRPTTGFC